MNLSNLKWIDFDGDPDGMCDLGFPTVDRYLHCIESFKGSFNVDAKKFVDGQRYDTMSHETLYDSEMVELTWQDRLLSGRDCKENFVTIAFCGRRSDNLLFFEYKDATVLEQSLFPDRLQRLYTQALAFEEGKYRHEFLFHNGLLIIEAEDFAFSETAPTKEVLSRVFKRKGLR